MSGGVVQLRLADQLRQGPITAAPSPLRWPISYDAASMLGAGVDPETPCRPDRPVPWLMDRATPSPLAPQALDYRLAMAQNDTHLDYKIAPHRLQTIYGDGDLEEADPTSSGSHATRRWKSPPAMPNKSLQGSPKTPTRARVFDTAQISGRSPPSSIKTPTRGLWVSETPSPDRMHHHMLPAAQPLNVLQPWQLGQICEMGWAEPYQAWPYA